MNNRPFILKGKINIIDDCDFLIGSIIKNDNVKEEEKSKYIQVLDDENINLYSNGYKAYIFQNEILDKNLLKKINYCSNIDNYDTLINFDVIEILRNRYIKVLYRDDSSDNVILVTNQCNSNCIMCPDSDLVRSTNYNPNINELIEQIKCIPNDTEHITITGGEPGLLKYDLIKLVRNMQRIFK